MQKTLILTFFVLFTIPLAVAQKCDITVDKKLCTEIINSELSTEEKEYLVSDIISSSKTYPDYQLVKAWNKQSPTNTPPDGISKYSKGFIEDAWIKILAVMPSILFNDTLLINSSGEILIGFNHQVNIPTGTDSGDCKTIRSLQENTEKANVYLNNIYVGSGNTVLYSNYFEHEEYVFVIVDYMITVKTRIDHYKKKEFCKKNKCTVKCVYHSTDIKTDELVIEDKIKARIEKPELSAQFNVKNKYLNTTKANLTFSESANLELLFENSSFKEDHFVFSEFTTLSPLNILTIKAEEYKNNEAINLAFSGNSSYEIVLKNTNNCMIILSSFFEKKIFNCNLNFTPVDITINTDKTIYDENEIINVEINPTGNYKVKYGNQDLKSSGKLQLKSVKSYNKILVESAGKTFEKIIHVKNKEPFDILLSVSIFAGTNVIFLGIMKRYWGVIL